jgi:SNF2 family DNA or RNA helicase
MQSNNPHNRKRKPDSDSPTNKRIKPDPIDVDLEDDTIINLPIQSSSQQFGVYNTDFVNLLWDTKENIVALDTKNPVNFTSWNPPKTEQTTITNLPRVKTQPNTILPIQEELPVQNVENLFQGKENELPEAPVPKFLCVNLLKHQRTCLTWMLSQEKGKYKGGILADEMGLLWKCCLIT